MSDLLSRAFEEKFRSSRSLIRSRLGVYRAFVSPLKQIHEDPRGLDLGCGRGEWLEVLLDEGIAPLGVDLDEGMLETCRSLQLPVLKSDAVTYLAGQPSESQAVISALNMVGHITLEQLQQLVSESLRVLVPGGLLIMQAPNPENIAVATCDFYQDPSHLRPVPPQMLGFLAEYCGFHRNKLLRLQQSSRVEHDTQPSLLDVLRGVSPEYAVIAQKSAPPKQLAAFDAAFGSEYGLQLQKLTDRYDAALAAKLEHAESTAQEAKILLDKAMAQVTYLSEAHALMEKQMAMTSQYVGQVDQRAMAAEQHLQAQLNNLSWRMTAPLRWSRRITAPLHWMRTQAGLLKTHGVRGRLATVLRKAGFTMQPPAQPASVGAPATPQDGLQVLPLPAPRHPGTHAAQALADPALAPLARPAALPPSMPVPGQSDGEVDHEPLLHLSVMQEAPASMAFVVLVGAADLPAIQRTVHSILRQTDPAWELVFHIEENRAHLVDDWLDGDWRLRRFVHPPAAGLSDLPQVFSLATARFVGVVEAGDTVDDDLVKSFNHAASLAEDADILYSDELWLSDGPDQPPFQVRKPAWSPEQQMSVDMLGRFCAIRKSLALVCETWVTKHACVTLYGLNIEAASRARAVVHVAELLYTRQSVGAGKPGGFFPPLAWEDLSNGMHGFLQRRGQEAEVQIDKNLGCLLVQPKLPKDVTVTVVILTAMRVRDIPGRGKIQLAENLVRSILEKTRYPNYRILLVDDGACSQTLTELLREHGHRKVSYREKGAFSFAKKTNFATRQADDGIVILLNDDMEVVSPDWIHWMVAHANQPEVGVVGAKLLYANNTIQHAGMVVGMNGHCGHALHKILNNREEYLGLASIDRNCSAVTGAAMAYRKSVFESLGGFDEAFRVDYNDIDFSLRCIESNLRVVFASQAVLYHFHNSSFGRPHDDESERTLFQSRWSHLLESDDYFPTDLLKQSLTPEFLNGLEASA